MLRRVLALCALLALAPASTLADLPPDNQSYAWADNCGRFTIAPGGGETLVEGDNDYRIHVMVLDWNGDPVPGILATDMWLQTPDMVPCPGQFSQADDATDATGYTSFSGTIFAGLVGDARDGVDCEATNLYVYALGIVLNYGQPVCVAVDSPDLNGDLTVGVADFALFAWDFNAPDLFDPCHDFYEDGQTSIADFGQFAGYFNASACP